MADEMTNANLAIMIRALRDFQITRWTTVSGLALFTYDILLTLRREYQFVWAANWSIGKILYVIMRYPIFVGGIVSLFLRLYPNDADSVKRCRVLTNVDLFGGFLELSIAQIIFGLRTVALYDLQRWIILFLGVLGFVAAGVRLAFYVAFSNGTVYSQPPFSQVMVGCYRECAVCYTYRKIFLVPIMVFDSAVFLLSLFKFHQLATRSSNVKAPLLRVLYRDGFIYFATFLAVVLVNLVIFNVGQPSQFETLTPFLRTMPSLMCSRLLLNLRGALLQTSNQTSTFPSSHFSRTPRASTHIGIWRLASSPSALFRHSATPQLESWPAGEAKLSDGVRHHAQSFEMIPRSQHQTA